MKTTHEIRLLFQRRIRETLRDPVWIISGLATPLLYLALFTPLLNGIKYPLFGTGNVLDSFVPGILALMAFGSGMGAGWIVIWELQSGVIERFRVSPVRRFSLLMGTVLRDILIFLVQALLTVLIASLFGFHIHWMGIIVALILFSLWTAVVSALSGSLGLIFKQIGGLAAVMTGIQLPLTLLAGVLLPLSLGPEWLRVIAHFNPMYYIVEASRILARGTIGSNTVLIAFVVILPLTVIALSWATNVYRKAIS